MKNFLKTRGLVILVLSIVFVSLFVQTKTVSAQSINPIVLIQKTTEIIVGRVFDLIDFLVKQKKYIFNNYTDPNIYPPLNVPKNVVAISSTTKKTASNTVVTGKPVLIVTSNLPPVKKTSSVPVVVSSGQVTPPVPGLVVKTVPVSNPVAVPISTPNDNLEILNYTNVERVAMSLSPLTANSILDQIAGLRADDLFANQYFEHESPDGKSAPELAKKIGFNYLLIGENLALGNFGSNQKIVDAWMASPGHKANILNGKYEELESL
jgi:uncharacterized protein YkwD